MSGILLVMPIIASVITTLSFYPLFTGANSAMGRSPFTVLSYQDSSWGRGSRNQLRVTSLQSFARVEAYNSPQSPEVDTLFAIGSLPSWWMLLKFLCRSLMDPFLRPNSKSGYVLYLSFTVI